MTRQREQEQTLTRARLVWPALTPLTAAATTPTTATHTRMTTRTSLPTKAVMPPKKRFRMDSKDEDCFVWVNAETGETPEILLKMPAIK